MMASPRLMLLDEPISGLDPEGMLRLRERADTAAHLPFWVPFLGVPSSLPSSGFYDCTLAAPGYCTKPS